MSKRMRRSLDSMNMQLLLNLVTVVFGEWMWTAGLQWVKKWKQHIKILQEI